MIECRVCGRKFENMASLAGHIRGHSQSSFQRILIEALNKQSELLEKILVELEEIHSLLRGLNVVETRIEATSRTIASSNTQAKTEEKEESSLPSFLKGNPWVEILSRRTD